MKFFHLLSIPIFLTFVPFAHAELDWSPCTEDAKQYCTEMALGSDRAAQCLEKFMVMSLREDNPKLTSGCISTVRHWQFHSICKGDIQKLCSNISSGEHRIHECMKKNEHLAANECKNFLGNYLEESDPESSHLIC